MACLPFRRYSKVLSVESEELVNRTGTRDEPNDAVAALRDEFRQHLELFYSQLKLAPPYHSLEKAVALLGSKVKAMGSVEQARLLADPALRWEQFSQVFVESGLNRKHRGIIAHMCVTSSRPSTLSQEYESFLKSFSS